MDRSDINNEQHTLSLNHSQLATQTLFKSLPRFVDGTQDHDFNSARFRMEGARDDKKSLMLSQCSHVRNKNRDVSWFGVEFS